MGDDMNTIYRLTYEGLGIYSSGIDERVGITWSENRHPMPYNDTLLWTRLQNHPDWLGRGRIYGIGRFGFSSIQQLRYWFYDQFWRDRFEDYGVKIEIWECPEEWSILGDTQAVFVPKHCNKVGYLEWKDV